MLPGLPADQSFFAHLRNGRDSGRCYFLDLEDTFRDIFRSRWKGQSGYNARHASGRSADGPWLSPRGEVLRDSEALEYTEVEIYGKRFLLRSDRGAATAAVFRAAGMAVPPNIQKVQR